MYSKLYRKLLVGKIWEEEYIYYLGDISNIDFKTDWRTCQVKDKREQLVFIELTDQLTTFKT